MKRQDIFRLRLKTAREMNGLSMAALAERMGNMVTPQAVYKYEAGKMMPDSTVLNVLCDVLKVQLDYFFRPFTVIVEDISFRKKAKMGEKEKVMLEGKIKNDIERYLEIEEICGIQEQRAILPFDKVVCDERGVYQLATSLREDWYLGKSGIRNVIGLLEEHGILVIETETSNDFDGLCGKVRNRPVIVLNKHFSPERKRFTALHELGHILMRFSDNLSPKEEESMCNLFANETLIPSDIFRKSIGDITNQPIHVNQFLDLQVQYGISFDALMYKAKKLQMISESRYVKYRKYRNTNEEFKQYVDESRIQEEKSDRFESMVYRALAFGLISQSKAASLLQIQESDIYQEYI